MKKLFLIFSLVLASFPVYGFEISFGSSSKSSEIPKWVANPTEDDAEYIYGIGDGNSLAKAEQAALNNISGKLATVVSSNISANTTLSQGKTSAYFSQDVRTKTFDTKLSNYEVVQSTSQNGVYYAMVKMSRSAFVKDTMTRLTSVDERVNAKVAVAKKVSKLQHFLALNEIKPDLVEATTLVLLLQAASPRFNGEKYLSTYRGYQAQADEMLYQLHFKVDAGSGMAPVAEMVIRLLGDQKLSASLAGGEQADATILITGEVQKRFIFSEYSTQLRVNIQIRDKSGRKLNTKERVVAGSSMTNYESSLRTAINLLQKQLEDEGILAVLGLQTQPS